jgi:hypothetical protein
VVETTDEEGGSTTVTYTLSFKTKVFEGAFESELKDGVFTVTLDEKTAESISGLEGTTFEIAIPTGDPSGIEFIYPAPHKDKLWIVVGEAPTDLKEYLEATGGRVDYIEDVIWTSDREDKLTVTPEGILTAVTEWNGDIVASYVKTNGTKIEVTIHVGAVLNRNDIPTSTEAVTGVTKSITFAGGELKVKGYEGATVTVYSLNGSVVAHFIAGSGEASYGLGLNKGFYIAKVGSEVIKFVAK